MIGMKNFDVIVAGKKLLVTCDQAGEFGVPVRGLVVFSSDLPWLIGMCERLLDAPEIPGWALAARDSYRSLTTAALLHIDQDRETGEVTGYHIRCSGVFDGHGKTMAAAIADAKMDLAEQRARFNKKMRRGAAEIKKLENTP